MDWAIGIPALEEGEELKKTLNCLENQDHKAFSVWILVNQPEGIEPSPENQKSLNLAKKEWSFPLHMKFASQTDVPSKHKGVGWARRELWNWIAASSSSNLWVSLDADTLVPKTYLSELDKAFRYHELNAFAAPFWHAQAEPDCQESLARYEVYMRYMQCQLFRIGSPFAPAALGSCLAFTREAYKRAGSFPKRQAGEDFYLLQNLIKQGRTGLFLQQPCQPSGRISTRVPFGTGPAIKNLDLQKRQYPFFVNEAFNMLQQWFNDMPHLQTSEIGGRWVPYFKDWQKVLPGMRTNHKKSERFRRACMERMNGLRIIQFLKLFSEREGFADLNLAEVGSFFGVETAKCWQSIRKPAFEMEMSWRRKWKWTCL